MSIWNKLAGKPSKDEFAAMVIKALRANGEKREIQYDAQEFKLVIEGGGSEQIWLDNAHNEYCAAARDARQSVIERYARAPSAQSEALPASFEEALPNIFPRIRHQNHYGITRLRFQVHGLDVPEPSHRQVAEHLAVGLIYDRPQLMQEVTEADVARWGIPLEDVLNSATENLWRISTGDFDMPRGVFVSPWKDNHDASRLFLHDMISQFAVEGDHVAAVPNRDTLIVTGSGNADGLARMATLCESGMKQSHPVSAVPVVLRNKAWSKFSPEPGHPTHQHFKRLRIVEEANDYAQQKTLLEGLLKKTGEDVFVGSYTAMEKKDTGEISSYCVWTEGVATLLARAEEVAFVASDKLVARVPWSRAAQAFGDLMAPTEMLPARFRVESFPSADRIASAK